MAATALVAFVFGFLPFNTNFSYPGDQAGKGAALISQGCIVAGNTALDQSGNMQLLYACMDHSGTILWADSIYWDSSTAMLNLEEIDSGVVFTGSSSNSSTAEDALAWAVTSDFQELWTFHLNLPLQERFTSAAQGSDGNVVCAGSTNSIGAGGNDVLMVAIDENGDQLFRKTYGTTGEEAVYHISPCDDGGFILACQAMDWGAGNGDYWIIRTDSMGDTLWTGTYGGAEFDYPWRVIQSGEYYYVAGNTLSYGEGSYDWWILKLDSSGNILWDRTWGSRNTDTCMALAETDSGILVGGSSEEVQNEFRATAVGFDENGNVTHEWFYQPGMIRSITATDEGYLMGGTTYFADGDLWALSVDSTGYAPEMGIETGESVTEPLLERNPVNGILALNLPVGSNAVYVRDLSGRTVYEEKAGEGRVYIQLPDLPSGVYSITTGQGIERRFTLLR